MRVSALLCGRLTGILRAVRAICPKHTRSRSTSCSSWAGTACAAHERAPWLSSTWISGAPWLSLWCRYVLLFLFVSQTLRVPWSEIFTIFGSLSLCFVSLVFVTLPLVYFTRNTSSSEGIGLSDHISKNVVVSIYDLLLIVICLIRTSIFQKRNLYTKSFWLAYEQTNSLIENLLWWKFLIVILTCHHLFSE